MNGRVAAAVGLLCALAAATVASLAGCGGAPHTAGAAWSSAADIQVVTASVHVPANTPGVAATATCPSGDQMIGGGYAATDIFEYDAVVAASYPSSGSAWTAVSGSSAFYTLTAEVYCLPALPDIGGGIALDGRGPAACPPPGVALSVGVNGANSSVVCASKHVSGLTTINATFNPHSSSHSYYAVDTMLTCPAAQTATGGWLTGGGLALASHSAGAPYTGWAFTLGGDSDIALSVTCVTLSAA